MVLVEFEAKTAQIGVIKLNDPDQLNAMGVEMATEFKALTKELKQKTELRVLIITGSGRAFSAGGNLEMLKEKTKLSQIRNKELMLDFYSSFLGILDLKIPLIAAINGPAVGAGMCLASACDFRLAVTGTKLGFTFLKLGLHPGMGATIFLPRIIGYPKSTELLYSAKIITSEEAFTIGLINQLAADAAGLASEALKIANELLLVGPKALSQLVETMRPAIDELKKGLDREANCQSINYNSPEFLEGIQATIEKRLAKF